MRLFSAAKLSKVDRWVLFIVLAYWILGSLLTFIAQQPGRSETSLIVILLTGAAILLVVLVVLWRASRIGSIPIGYCGFSHGWGMWVNLGVTGLITVRLWEQLPPTSLALPGWTPLMILGAFTEEVVIRVYLIRIVSLLISPRKGHVHWAVFISAIIFTAGHLGRQSGLQLNGLFISSVVVGYLTYYTRSVLFAAFYHVLSNTGPQLGLLGGVIAIAAYFVISLASWLGQSRLAKRQLPVREEIAEATSSVAGDSTI